MNILASSDYHYTSPVSYGVPEMVSNRTERGDVEPQDDRPHQGAGSCVDAYHPDPRKPGESALEIPEAVRGTADCAMRQEEQARETSQAHGQAPSQNEGEQAKSADETDRDRPIGGQELSEDEQRQVEELQRRDQEVRAHEQAHVAAGARNLRYDYQAGPDGRSYAVGGSCDIDMTYASDDPDAKMSEAARMRAAALAPAEPSSQDLSVAAKATRAEAEATAEKAEAQLKELQERQEEKKEDEAGILQAGNLYGAPEEESVGFAAMV